MQVQTTGNALGNMAAEAQVGLANASLISQTLKHLNGGAGGGAPELSSLAETTKNMVNAAMGKGLQLDAMA